MAGGVDRVEHHPHGGVSVERPRAGGGAERAPVGGQHALGLGRVGGAREQRRGQVGGARPRRRGARRTGRSPSRCRPAASGCGSARCSSRHRRALVALPSPAMKTASAPLAEIVSTSFSKLLPGAVEMLSWAGTWIPAACALPATIVASALGERVHVVEHVHAVDPERAHQLDLGLRLGGVARDHAPEGLLPARVEAPGLVLAGVERGGEADIGAGGAHLQHAGAVDQRQRDRRGGRVEVAQVGDRARILGGALGVAGGDARVPDPGLRVGVVERDVADLVRPGVRAPAWARASFSPPTICSETCPSGPCSGRLE